jgi:RNA polymerase sigma-70 factor (ECF subfamily)
MTAWNGAAQWRIVYGLRGPADHRLSVGGPAVIHGWARAVTREMNASSFTVETRLAASSLPRSVALRARDLMSNAIASRPDLSALIVAIARRGDRAAFAILFNYFAPRVKSYMLRLGASQEAAEELAQETMLIVWRRAGAFDASRAAASTWIFTIARNLRIDALRRERRPSVGDDPSMAAPMPTLPDATISTMQNEVRIASAIGTLSADQARVVREAFFSDKPHSEIATDLGLPLGTVKSRLRLAMARLRTLLGEPL